MPAIDLARLKIQTARLAEKFTDPSSFLKSLNELLDLYTNRTMRRSQVVKRLDLATHHTPAPILRQVEKELAPLAEIFPEDAVALINKLWQDSSLESRLLAGRLLGMIPVQNTELALAHLPDWLAQTTNKEVRAVLLTKSLERLRSEKPDAFFTLLQTWLESPRTSLQVWGFRAIIPLLEEADFVNLPAAFRILRPAVSMAGPATQLDLQVCIQALERVSVVETIVFLREILVDYPDPLLIKTMRRILPTLHPKIQVSLRDLFNRTG